MRLSSRHRAALASLSLLTAVALAGCGADAGDGDKAAASSEAGGNGTSSDSLLARDSADAPAAEPASAQNDAVIERAVIATGELRMSTRKLDDVRQDAIDLTTGFRGHVANEQSQSDSHGRLDRVDLTLRVPSESFDKELDGLARLGTVRRRQQSVEDVTTQVIDNEARVKAQAASVASIERLLARATTIGEVMSIERQIASRQAELDSLKQQQKWLADQTSMSTVHLTLTRTTAGDDNDGGPGFLAGLGGGWKALGVTLVAIGTALGAVLPFAVLIALVGVPIWAIVRRRRPVATAPPATEV
jgi:hypothetical protein